MSYSCGIHGWQHMLNACPSCSTGVIATGSTNSDDQPQKPTGSFLCKTHGWHIEFHCPACPKPDATPREWWITRSPIDDKHTLCTVKPEWKTIELGHERIHVIEKSAYDAKCEEVAEAYEKYRLIKKANNELSRTDYVNFGKLIEERDALKQRVAELEARLLDYEEQVRESVLSGRNNAAFVEVRKERDAAKAEIERLDNECKSLALKNIDLNWPEVQMNLKLEKATAVIADGYEAREQKLVAENQRLTECLNLSNAVIKKNKGGG